MLSITAREIMDAAMALEDGGRIVTRCSSFNEMESLRSSLYKTRAALLRKHRALVYPLWISREIGENSWLVTVSKELSVSDVVIISKDGSVKPFERVEPAVVGEESETERMIRLMRQDRMSDEEIENTLAEKGEEDFDAAASKIEELQGIPSEGKKKKKGGE